MEVAEPFWTLAPLCPKLRLDVSFSLSSNHGPDSFACSGMFTGMTRLAETGCVVLKPDRLDSAVMLSIFTLYMHTPGR